MIIKIQAKDFKGLNFEQDLGRFNLIVGPNGSGKSSRTAALELLANGYIMGVGKKNQDIFEACSRPGNPKIFVGCTVQSDGRKFRFLKRYAKAEDSGSVGLVYHVHDTKASAASYAQTWGSVHAPRIIDPSIFMGLSGTKQIEEIYNLFPPDGDLSSLSMELEAAKEALNFKMKEKFSQEQLIASLVQAVSQSGLGQGTLADLEAEEQRTTTELDAAKAELAKITAEESARKMIEESDAKHAAEMKALSEKAAAEKVAAEKKAAQDKAEQDKPSVSSASSEPEHISVPIQQAINRLKDNARKIGATIPSETPSAPTPPVVTSVPVDAIHIAMNAITKVIDAMHRAGCSECAAILVAKRELILIKNGGKV